MSIVARIRIDSNRPRAIAATFVLLLLVSGAVLVGSGPVSTAQDAAPAAKDEVPPARTPRKPKVRQAAPAVPAGTVPAPTVPVATAPAAPTPANFALPLVKAGAGACASQVNALAGATMGGVASYNTAAHWALEKPDARPVSVFIGQKFAGTGVPYAASGIFAAPNGQGGCDGMSVQVVPSPLSCAKLRETLSAHGKQVGDLAGIPLMEDAGSQTMLVPTTADTCVLVGIRTAYAK